MQGLGPPAESRFAAARTEFATGRPHAWLVFLGIGLGVALGEALLSDGKVLQPMLGLTGLAATGAILGGVRMNRPASRLPWLLLAGCTLLTTIGVIFIPAAGAVGVLGQALTAIGSVAGFAGFILLVRGRIPGGDRAAVLDAAIVTSGTGVLIWAFGFAPFVVGIQQSSFLTAAVFYPTLTALAIVARMWFLRGAHRPATRLVVLIVLASNGIIFLEIMRGLIGPNAFTGLSLLAQFAELSFMGAAALHPSMAIAPERQRDIRHISRRRILVLAAALLVNPATLAIEVLLGRQIDPAPYLIGGSAIGLLVIARLGDALGQLRGSLHERDSLMALLRRQALYDGLTSLPNRSLFNERLAADFANRSSDRQLAVLLLDLDDFKGINDNFGHEAGDELLVAVGQRLRGAVREGDMAARFGGDEFVITLPACADPSVAIRVAERVLETLTQPFDIGGRRLNVRASIGLAVAGAGDRNADDLVRNADVAMYEAKHGGKGRVAMFEPSMQVAAQAEFQLRTDLAAGIARGDLRLHFQPVVDLRTGRTVGYEALVRWLRDGRLIPPGQFIAIAESSGLITSLTDWVVDEACRATAAWGNSGDRPWVSVNMSPSQLVRPDIVSRIGRALSTSGLGPDRLIIEITESSLLDIDTARPVLQKLSERGVRLAIDDFGTGYSALSYLARLPIDIVKIDRSFVIALQQAGPDEAIASAIIALARRLGLTTIGEGIETAAQLDQLTALGCDLGQGFFLGRPTNHEDLRPSPLPRGHRLRLPGLAGLGA
jgi:diguanylate cyclase (GGDEF)-like protein